jgi:6-phosphogluconolactonase
VSLDDPDSNYLAWKLALFDQVPIPRENIISITSPENPEEAALEYERRFLELVPSGALDLVLLGMGPDGHTASLFPNHPALSYAGPRQVIPIFDSPKPPSQRITLTLPALNKAHTVSSILFQPLLPDSYPSLPSSL